MRKFLMYWFRGAVLLVVLAAIIVLIVAVYMLLYLSFGENAALIIAGFLGASLLIGIYMMIRDM